MAKPIRATPKLNKEESEEFLKNMIFIENSKINLVSDMISDIISAKEIAGANISLDILVKSEDFESFEKRKELRKAKDEVEEEVRRLMDSYEAKKEEYDDIGFVSYEIETRLGLTAIITSMLSEIYPDKVVLVYRKSGDGWKISLRCQTGRVNLHDLIRACLTEKDSGGGHEKAGGGVVHNIEKFKEKLIKELKSR